MFRFRLQRVLDMRVQNEQDAASRLAAARSEEEAAVQERVRLEAARDEGIERAAASASAQPTVGQLQNLRYLVDRLNDEIEVVQHDVDTAAEGVRERLNEYSEAFRDRQMIDRLRDREMEAHRYEETQTDRKLMDSVALTRFVRTRASRSSPDA